MFTFDERIRGLPAARDQVVALYQSINSPHLAIPGKQAGPAQAFIVGLKGSQGLSVFVYLFLPQSADCAVYVSDRRTLSAEEFPDEENEALGFVESMGFIMDNMNFRALPPQDQENLMKALPLFRRDPKQGASGATAAPQKAAQAAAPSTAALARLLSSF